MYLEIPVKDLKPILKKANSVVETRNLTPILGNCLITTDSANITVTTSDAEVEIIITSPLEEPNLDDSENGTCCLPAKKLLDIVNNLPANGHVKLNDAVGVANDNRFKLTSGRSHFTLAGLPFDDFPTTPEFEEGINTLSLPQSILKMMLSNVAYAMAVNDARYYLNGAVLDIEKTSEGFELSIVATDGHRLAATIEKENVEFIGESFDVKTDDDGNELNGIENVKIILPKKMVTLLIKALSDKDDVVELKFDHNHVQVAIGNTIITSKLINGNYPNWRAVIPNNNENVVIAKRELLLSACSRALILSNEKFKGTRLTLSKDSLKVSCTNANKEVSEVVIDVDYQGDALEIGFNGDYLIEAITACSLDSVELRFSDANSSLLIVPRDQDDFKNVIMPMRL